MANKWIGTLLLVAIFGLPLFGHVRGKSHLERLRRIWRDVDISLDGCRHSDFGRDDFQACRQVALEILSPRMSILRYRSAYATAVEEYQRRLRHNEALLTRRDLPKQNKILKEKVEIDYRGYLESVCKNLAVLLESNKRLKGRLGPTLDDTSVLTTNCRISTRDPGDPISVDLYIQSVRISDSSNHVENFFNVIGALDNRGQFAPVEVISYEPSHCAPIVETEVWPIPNHHVDSYLVRCKHFAFWKDGSVAELTDEVVRRFEKVEFGALETSDFQGHVMNNVTAYYEYLEKSKGLLANDAPTIFDYNLGTYQRGFRDRKLTSTHLEDIADTFFENLQQLFEVEESEDSGCFVVDDSAIHTACCQIKTPSDYLVQYCLRTVANERFLYFVGKMTEKDEFVPLDLVHLRNNRNVYGVIPDKRQMSDVIDYAKRNPEAANLLRMIGKDYGGSNTGKPSRKPATNNASRSHTPGASRSHTPGASRSHTPGAQKPSRARTPSVSGTPSGVRTPANAHTLSTIHTPSVPGTPSGVRTPANGHTLSTVHTPSVPRTPSGVRTPANAHTLSTIHTPSVPGTPSGVRTPANAHTLSTIHTPSVPGTPSGVRTPANAHTLSTVHTPSVPGTPSGVRTPAATRTGDRTPSRNSRSGLPPTHP